jgi:hypothetical protein
VRVGLRIRIAAFLPFQLLLVLNFLVFILNAAPSRIQRTCST